MIVAQSHSQHADGGGDGAPDGHPDDVGVLQEPADLDLDATCSTKFQSTDGQNNKLQAPADDLKLEKGRRRKRCGSSTH